jgi:hypothetical protein
MYGAIWFVLLAVSWVMQAAPAQEITPSQDPNEQISGLTPRASGSHAARMVQVANQLMARGAMSDPTLCAVIVLPGRERQHPVWGLQCRGRPPRRPDHGLCPGARGTIVVA